MQLQEAVGQLTQLCTTQMSDRTRSKNTNCTTAAASLLNQLSPSPNNVARLATLVVSAINQANKDTSQCCGSITIPVFVTELEQFRDEKLPAISVPVIHSTAASSASSANTSFSAAALAPASVFYQAHTPCTPFDASMRSSFVVQPEQYWQRLKNHLSIARTAVLEKLFDFHAELSSDENKSTKAKIENLIQMLVLDIIELDANNLNAKVYKIRTTSELIQTWQKQQAIEADQTLSPFYNQLKETKRLNDDRKATPWKDKEFNPKKDEDNDAPRILRHMFRDGYKVPANRPIAARINKLESALKAARERMSHRPVPSISEHGSSINGSIDQGSSTPYQRLQH